MYVCTFHKWNVPFTKYKKMHKIKDRKARHTHTHYTIQAQTKRLLWNARFFALWLVLAIRYRCIWTAAAASSNAHTKSRARNLLISLFRSRQNKNQMNKLMSCPVLYVNSLSGWYWIHLHCSFATVEFEWNACQCWLDFGESPFATYHNNNRTTSPWFWGHFVRTSKTTPATTNEQTNGVHMKCTMQTEIDNSHVVIVVIMCSPLNVLGTRSRKASAEQTIKCTQQQAN